MKVSDFENKHLNERCFIFGNGPSLGQLPMDTFRSEVTFGSNRVFLGFDEWGYAFKYWAAQDMRLIEQNLDEFETSLPDSVVKFFPSQFSQRITAINAVFFDLVLRDEFFPRFSFWGPPFFEGWSVTYLLIQLAAFMGCNPIYLLGVDYNYVVDSEDGVTWADPLSQSHFHPDYMDAGRLSWNTPKPEMTDRAFARASEVCRLAGIRVINLNEASHLPFFEKKSLGSLLGEIQGNLRDT